MHVRDCPGTTVTFDVCPFPWCRKVKHLLYHLVSCPEPDLCEICSPSEVSHNMNALRALNDFRMQQRKEALARKAKAASKGKGGGNRKAAKTNSASGKSQQRNKPAAAHSNQQDRPANAKVAVVATASKPNSISDALVSSKIPAIAKSTQSPVGSAGEAVQSKPNPSMNGESSTGPVENSPSTSLDKLTDTKNPQVAMTAAAVVDSSLPKSSPEMGSAKQKTVSTVVKEEQSALIDPPVSVTKPESNPNVVIKKEEDVDGGKNLFQLQASAGPARSVKAEEKVQSSGVSLEKTNSQSKEPKRSCSANALLEDKNATLDTATSKEMKADPQVDPSTKTKASVCDENISSTKGIEASSCSKCGSCGATTKNKEAHSGPSATVVE